MTKNKTQPNDGDVVAFIQSIDNKRRRMDAETLLPFFTRITDRPATLWGDRIIGFGSYHYKYATGREGDWCLTGFSPGKAHLSLYIMDGFSSYQGLLDKLGKHKHSKSCLYINKLDDIDLIILEELITQSINTMRERYHCW